MELEKILKSNDLRKIRALFTFNTSTPDALVLLKFNVWGRYHHKQYFKSEDAEFHEQINQGNLDIYRNSIDSFVDIAFRGAGKDMKTKLFIAFAISNDRDHFRKYFRILSEDGDNSKQSATDIYNILIKPKMVQMYPEIFEKTKAKREETMGSFTTSTGIKVTSDTVGVDQRGANQEETRPDFIWYNDFETKKTMRSMRETKSIWDNMEEARTGLEKNGGCVYTCNYFSEQGNVHKLVTEKLSPRKRVLIVPISKDQCITPIIPTWDRYTIEDIKQMMIDDDDFDGERLCKPNASKDIYFDRESLDLMPIFAPKKIVGDLKIYREYIPGHKYAGGQDVAGGVGLDSSTSVILDFSTVPAQVVATYASNEILPEAFGDEIYSQANRYGECLMAPENNKFDSAVLKAKLLGTDIYKMPPNPLKIKRTFATEYGWNTNGLTKSNMLGALRQAIEDGLISLNDKDLIAEMKSYTRNDLIEVIRDPRLATRHYDLVIALAIAWQMKDHAKVKVKKKNTVNTQWTKKTNPAL